VSLAETIQGPILKLHQQLYEHSGGKVGHRMLGVPALLLRSTGRRSGAQRCNALIYAPDGADFVLVASNGAKPEVEVQIGRTRSPGIARSLEPADAEYGRLWRLVNDNNHGRYDAYQRKTARPIALVVVSPA
jgi:deazaflavin-dependent oxidoreductase (nitroreductase family)